MKNHKTPKILLKLIMVLIAFAMTLGAFRIARKPSINQANGCLLAR